MYDQNFTYPPKPTVELSPCQEWRMLVSYRANEKLKTHPLLSTLFSVAWYKVCYTDSTCHAVFVGFK